MDSQKMKASVLVDTNVVETQLVDVPRPDEDEILVRIGACGVCTTDYHIYRGEFVAEKPLIQGHESAGTVAKVGSEVEGYKPGDRVAINPGIPCGHCRYCKRGRLNLCENYVSTGGAADEIDDGSFAEYVTAPQSRIEPIGDLPFTKAAFAEPLACVIHGLDRTNIEGSDTAVVLGTGPIGLKLAQALKYRGAGTVVAVEPIDDRRELAAELGADRTVDPTEYDIVEWVSDELDKVNVAIEAIGKPATIEQAFEVTSPGGTTLVFGVPPLNETISLSPFRLYYDEIDIHGSYAKTPRSFEQAVSMLRNDQIDIEPLITDVLNLDEVGDAYQHMRHSDGVKWMVVPEVNDNE